jgi:hypothetical protein
MMGIQEKGRAAAKIDGVICEYQYTIENIRDTTFDLTVWYRGESIRERVSRYLMDPHEDVRAPHGPMLLAALIGGEWTLNTDSADDPAWYCCGIHVCPNCDNDKKSIFPSAIDSLK